MYVVDYLGCDILIWIHGLRTMYMYHGGVEGLIPLPGNRLAGQVDRSGLIMARLFAGYYICQISNGYTVQ